MIRYAFIALSVALVTRPGIAQDKSSALDVVPVYREPSHRLVFENGLVRVLEVRVGPGDTTQYHVHANRLIGVVIASVESWEQMLGGEALRSAAFPLGMLLDNSSASLPYTHRVGNAGSAGFHYVIGEVVSSSGIDAPSLRASTGLKLDRETAEARIYRVTLAPGQSTEAHRHEQPGLTVQVGPGTLSLEGTAPEATSTDRGAGAWWWRAARADHVVRNVGATTVDIVEIDWR